ncbi:MAG TPA: hypothetical protein ENI23_14045 [bacterium]|nr:hypothetical protein [bacterium]
MTGKDIALAGLPFDRIEEFKNFIVDVQSNKRLTQRELAEKLNAAPGLYCPPSNGSKEPRPWTKGLVSSFMVQNGMRRRSSSLTPDDNGAKCRGSGKSIISKEATEFLCLIQMTIDLPTGDDVQKLKLIRTILS